MKMCERCGSEISDDKIIEKFKCSICKDVKIERNLLKPLVKIVRNNFRALKEEFNFLENLYTFGSYATKSLKCGDIDLLVILNRDLLKEFIEDKLKCQREAIWNNFGLEEDLKSIVKYLDKDAFFDFRKCQEYPDACLDCSEQEGCTYEVKYWKGRPNYCLLECRYARLPSCMNQQDPFCNWYVDWDLDESKRLFLEDLLDQVKNKADKRFTILNLEVKVIHLSCYTSIDEFYQINENLHFNLRLLE